MELVSFYSGSPRKFMKVPYAPIVILVVVVLVSLLSFAANLTNKSVLGPSEISLSQRFFSNKTDLQKIVSDPQIHTKLLTEPCRSKLLTAELVKSGFRSLRTHDNTGLHFIIWELRTPKYSKEKGLAFYPGPPSTEIILTQSIDSDISAGILAKEIEPHWYCYSMEYKD